jgi:tagatose 1,6-diphosphate aldolase
LHREGVGVLDSLSKLTKTKAKSWSAQYPVFDHIKKEGDFARAY